MVDTANHREMQISTTGRCHRLLTRMATVKQTNKQTNKVGEDVEKLEPLCIVGGNVK